MRLFTSLAALLLAAALFGQWVRLPSAHQGIWMSPDETANAVAAVDFARNQTFLLPYGLVRQFPWAVPRSFVAMVGSGAIAPVGFLGMPLLLAFVYKIAGLLGLLFFAPILALLTLWPLYHSLPRSWSRAVKFLTLTIWMSFPAVIIYANRGTFANLPIVCAAIWLWWMLVRAKSRWVWPLVGLVLGLACAARPPEAIWLVPLTIFAMLYRTEIDSPEAVSEGKAPRKVSVLKRLKPTWAWLACGLIFLATILGVAYLGQQTYGHWLVSGYQISPIAVAAATTTTVVQTKSLVASLPFAVHPRNILWNLWHYLILFLWPWSLCLGLALVYLWKDKAWRRPEKWVLAGLGFAAFWLVLFYGNGIYQDHVGVNVASLGNSYLRYTLPLSVVFALGAGYVMDKLWRSWTTRTLVVCLAACLIAMGQWNALFRDDEGMQANQREMARYADIRDSARQWLDSGTIVLSDRSDKIFFPLFTTVSPLPSPDDIAALLKVGSPVAVFLPTQNQGALSAWSDQGFDLRLLFTNGMQSLYDVR